MRRREIATAVGVGLLAGCQGGGSGAPEPGTESPTATSTKTATATATEEPSKPSVDTVSLVAEWEDFGDLAPNAIDTAAPVPRLTVALAYTLPGHDSSFDIRTKVRVLNSDGGVVGTSSDSEVINPSTAGETEWETDATFDARDWDHGEYTIEASVRDDGLGTKSETATGTFELAEPITDVEVMDIETPHSVAPGDPYQTTVTIRNTSGRDGTFVSPISYRVGADFEQIGEVHLTIPKGASRDWVSGEIEFKYPGEITFRMDETDTKWVLQVED